MPKILTIDDMQKLAELKNGLCLSTKYINRDTRLIWQCAQGHQWEATSKRIKEGSWCIQCFRDKAKGTIEQMEAIAKEREGHCISKTYIGSKEKLNWVCKMGHQWEATPSNIKQGSWCPVCA